MFRLVSPVVPIFACVMLLTLALPSAASAETVADVAARGRCSTAGLEGISVQLADAQRCLRPGAFVRFAPHPGITLSSSRVHPFAQASTRDALHRAAESTSLTINSAFRTVADQYVLYHSGGCGLAATPGRSNHQSGRAVDVGNYGAARSALEAQGCSWLGSRDPVHFDCPGSDRRNDSVLAFQQLWNHNNPGDLIEEDGLYGDQTARRLAQTPAGGFARDLCDMEPDPMAEGGRLIGVVFEDPDLDARVAGAHVQIVDTDHSMTVGEDGLWEFDLPPGEYTVEASADGYVTGRRVCAVEGGEVWCSVGLTPGEDEGTIRGVVFEDTGKGFSESAIRIEGATVVVTDTGEMLTTDADGEWSTSLPPGEHAFTVSKEDYASATHRCTVEAGAEAWCVVGLAPAEGTGALEGYVHVEDDPTERVIGAKVEVIETGASAMTREGDGRFRLELPEGAYTLEVTADGVETTERRCEVAAGETRQCSIAVAVVDPDAASTESAKLGGGCSASGRGTGRSLVWSLLVLVALLRSRRRSGR